MNLRKVFIAAVLALTAGSSAAAAEADDTEIQVDDGLKRFGYLAGLARGCVADHQRTGFEREALDLHNAIGRLLGTDRAFLFAAAFGHGTSVTLETDECKEVLSRYEARVENFRLERGVGQ